MFDFLKPRRTPSQVAEPSPAPPSNSIGDARGTPLPEGLARRRRGAGDPDVALKDVKQLAWRGNLKSPRISAAITTKGGTPRLQISRHQGAEQRTPRRAPPNMPGQPGLAVLKPPQTPTTPRTMPHTVPRTVPRTAGRPDSVAGEGHDSVKILVRVRPFSETEVNLGSQSSVAVHSEQQISLLPHSEATHYVFDRVLSGDTSQSIVFEAAGKAVVNSCFAGYNACVFAYGQTGSGKTFTMLGDIPAAHATLSSGSGLIPRIFDHLLSEMDRRERHLPAGCQELRYECNIGMLEIYNETITDLLNPDATNLQIREDAHHGIRVDSLSQMRVHTVSDVLALLDMGTKNRHIGETRMNRESSRSHCVLICSIKSTKKEDGLVSTLSSRLNLVDLAGSEAQKMSGASGERLREAANINKSLSILGRVINSLAAQQKSGARIIQHVPYRDSKLTFLLQDSLGGNSKTVMIANISPSTSNITETQSTLRFAQRAKKMGNKAAINENASGDIEALQREVLRLRKELAHRSAVPDFVGRGGLTPLPASMATPTLASPCMGLLAHSPSRQAVSPHSMSVSALVHAVERAQQAEGRADLSNKKCIALESQIRKLQQGEMARQMVEKFRDSEMASLQQAMQTGRIQGAEQLVCDTNEKLKARVRLMESQRDAAKAEARTAHVRVQELQHRVAEADRLADQDKLTLQNQVHNLQNLLFLLKPAAEGQDGKETPLDLLREEQAELPGPKDMMAKGLEALCTQRTNEADALEAERERHQAEVKQLEERWSRQLAQVRAEYEAQEASARQQLDDTSRIHDDLVAVRTELAEARTETEALYHKQLVPAQKEAARLREEKAQDAAVLADLQEQIQEFKASLEHVTSAKRSAEQDTSELRRVLEQYQAENGELRARTEQQEAEIGELGSRSELLACTQKDMEEWNQSSEQHHTEVARLQWEVARLREARRTTLAANAAVGDQERSAQAIEALQQEREALVANIEMLRTEVAALQMDKEHLEGILRTTQDQYQHEVDRAQAAFRASEHQRLEEQQRSHEAVKLERERWTKEKSHLQTSLTARTEELLASRQSASDLEVALQAVNASSRAADLKHKVEELEQAQARVLDANMKLREEKDGMEQELRRLQHEVEMCQETIWHGKRHSASSGPDAPVVGAALGAKQADTQGSAGEVSRLQAALEQALRQLDAEKGDKAQRIKALREEVEIVRNAATDECDRQVDALKRELRALRDAHNSAPSKAGDQGAASNQEHLLRDYAQLAGNVMQLAAYMLAEDTAAQLQCSFAAGSDENQDKSNQGDSVLLSPRAAALALKCGTVGSSLGRNEQWDKIARMVTGTGCIAPVELLGDGHGELKSVVLDLLRFLNAEYISI